MTYATRIAAWFLAAALLAAGCFPRTLTRPKLPDEPPEVTMEPDVRIHRLGNGATLAIAPEPNTNVVSIDVRYRVGAADDPQLDQGLAHFVEHTLYLLRDSETGPTLADRLAAVALSHNAYTTWDETHYTATALAGALPELIELETARMTARCDQLDEELIEREKDVVIQEVLERTAGAEHAGLMNEIFGETHPYGRAVGGEIGAIRSFTADDVCRFHRRYYSPDRAIVVVSGAVDPERARDRLEEAFGNVPRLPAAERPRPERLVPGEGRAELDVDHPMAVIAFPATRFGTRAAAVSSVARIVMRQRLTVKAFERDDVRAVDQLHFGAYREPFDLYVLTGEEDADLPALVERFFELKKEISREVYDELAQALARDRQTMLVRRMEPFRRRAIGVADYLQYADGDRLALEEIDRLGSVDGEAVGSAIARELHRARARVVLVKPSQRDRRESLRALLDRTTRDHDIRIWREPVDPADAERPAQAPKRPAGSKPRELRLDNGLRVVMVPDLHHPLVDVRLILPVGHRHAPGDHLIVPYLAAYLRGMPNLERYAFRDQLLARRAILFGGIPFANVRETSTTLGVRGAAVDVNTMLWQLQFELSMGDYSSALLEEMRDQITRSTEDDELDAIDEVALDLFGEGPGELEDLLASARRVEAGDLRGFADRHYHVGGATLLIVGKFDAEAVAGEVRRLFGGLSGGESPPEPRTSPGPEAPTARELAIEDGDARQVRVMVAYRIPRARSPRDRAAQLVANELVEYHAQQIRDRLGASYGVSVAYVPRGRHDLMVIDTSVSSSAAAKAVGELETALRTLATSDLRADFVRARKRLIATLLAAPADSDSVADQLSFAIRVDQPWTFPDLLLRQVAALTYQRAQRRIADALGAEPVVRVLAGPKGILEQTYRALGVTGVSWIK